MDDLVKEINNKLMNISYGFIDSNNNIHRFSKNNYLRDNYFYMSIDEINKYKVGTCLEITELGEYYLKEYNITSKKIFIYYKDNRYMYHSFNIVNNHNKYYIIDGSWILKEYVFNSYEDAIISICKLFPRMFKIGGVNLDNFETYEYDIIPFKSKLDDIIKLIRNNNKLNINYEKIYN